MVIGNILKCQELESESLGFGGTHNELSTSTKHSTHGHLKSKGKGVAVVVYVCVGSSFGKGQDR